MNKLIFYCLKIFSYKLVTLFLVSADVIFIIEEKPHEIFTRENDNLVMVVKVTLQEALLGTTVTVNTLDHRIVRVPITDIIR